MKTNPLVFAFLIVSRVRPVWSLCQVALAISQVLKLELLSKWPQPFHCKDHNWLKTPSI